MKQSAQQNSFEDLEFPSTSEAIPSSEAFLGPCSCPKDKDQEGTKSSNRSMVHINLSEADEEMSKLISMYANATMKRRATKNLSTVSDRITTSEFQRVDIPMPVKFCRAKVNASVSGIPDNDCF